MPIPQSVFLTTNDIRLLRRNEFITNAAPKDFPGYCRDQEIYTVQVRYPDPQQQVNPCLLLNLGFQRRKHFLHRRHPERSADRSQKQRQERKSRDLHGWPSREEMSEGQQNSE